jgi:hypothetical protein
MMVVSVTPRPAEWGWFNHRVAKWGWLKPHSILGHPHLATRGVIEPPPWATRVVRHPRQAEWEWPGHPHLATRGWLNHPQSSHKGSRALEPPLLA